MKWRKWNNIIHRDLGYFCVGLTVVYAVSGIAVNHTSEWNPNFQISKEQRNIGPLPEKQFFSDDVIPLILQRLHDPAVPETYFRPDSQTIQIFLEGKTITADLGTGKVLLERVKSRKILHEMNFLHLNHPKKLWTYVADLYAVSLGALALTGIFVLKGKNGFRGRRKWLVAAGILLPLIFLLLYY